MAATDPSTLRQHLNPDDAAAIAEVHRMVYGEEYGYNDDFVFEVERDVRFASRRGWPEAGAVWLVELDGRVAGSLALTFEGANRDGVFVGQLRWLALELELRGSGLARRLLEDLFDTAEDQGMDQLELDTCAELTAAAHLFAAYGFELTSERERTGWRRDGTPVRYQHYVARL
jgi:GNAT superfamily N-acetyltransferase